MSINTGTTGDAFILDGVFDGTESVVFIDDNSMTPYPATVTVTATQIVGTIPDVGGITGPFSVVATNRAGRNSAPVAFDMN
jgi:rRNA processing protein Gar1